MIQRTSPQFLILCACLTIVLLVPTQPPALGACGTAYYFVVYMLSSLVAQTLNLRALFPDGQIARQATFFALNFAIAGAPALAFYRRRAWFGRGYPVVMALWTGLYLMIYFFALPTSDCP